MSTAEGMLHRNHPPVEDAEIDAETIRQTYDAVLWTPEPLGADERERLGLLLVGHVQLLLPDVAALAGRAHGEQRRTAQHVMRRTHPTLRAAGSSPDAVALWDLATICRALLTLYRHMRPLPEDGSS